MKNIKFCAMAMLVATSLCSSELFAQPYYAGREPSVRIPINRPSVRPRPNIASQPIGYVPQTVQAPQIINSAPARIAQPVANIQPYQPAIEPVIIESTEPPAIFANKRAAAAPSPFVSNPPIMAQPVLPITLPDRTKAQYLPKNGAISAPTQSAQNIQPQIQQQTNVVPSPSPQAQPLPQNPQASPKSVEREYGWSKYVPPEMRNVKPEPIFNGRIYTGYRIDSADWSVAGDINGANPPTLSELEFKKIQMNETGGEVNYTQRDGAVAGAHVEGSAYYATAFGGTTRDSDYAQERDENGQLTGNIIETSRSSSSNDDSDGYGYKVAVGYEIRMDSADKKTKAWATPIIGYSVKELNINLQDGVQQIPDTGAFAGLDSNYKMEWNGAFAGVKGGFSNGNHLMDFRAELHSANFDGTGEWNLRQSFAQPKSFINSGNGLGFELGGDYNYLFADSGWGIFGGLKYRSFSIEDGIDTVIFSNGTTSSQKLNEVSWDSQLYRVGARYQF